MQKRKIVVVGMSTLRVLDSRFPHPRNFWKELRETRKLTMSKRHTTEEQTDRFNVSLIEKKNIPKYRHTAKKGKRIIGTKEMKC